ncbi:PQQ-binding-like beta-propeller repeat protein [Actinoplanes sp. NPDC049548]|uniref:outer membrane protein assembly factor BamB family protein n=1 Tax=Actinoplanes sp. NPDC049548 TaxID=3155152 RepID=UPI00342242F7
MVADVPLRAFAGHADHVPDAVPLIDLDVAPPRAPTRPGALHRRLVPPRPVLVLGVLVLVLLGLAAAVPPAPAMVPVLSAGGTAAAAFALGPAALYTATFGQNPNSESGIRRYDLPAGTQVWATAVPQNVQALTVDAASGVLLARSGSDPRMTFLDAADGSILWHLESAATSAIALTNGKVLLRTDVGKTTARLSVADARTGAADWSRIMDNRSEVHDGPDRIVVIGADGHVTTLRFADGALLGEGDLGVRLPVQQRDYATADAVVVSVVGDRIYVSRREQGKTSTTAYGLPALTVDWRTTGGPVGAVYDCSPVLCISDTRWVSGLDRADGSVLWSDPAWSSAQVTPQGLVAYDQSENPEAAVIDPATGGVVRRLGHVVTLGEVGLRSDTTVPGRTWVGVTDRAGRPHTVGSLDTAAPYGCEARMPYLACPTTAGPTGVWRLPAP